MVRKEIEAIPGRHHTAAKAFAFYDGVTLRLKDEDQCVAVTVAGSDITFDFTGSSPQTPGFVNAPYSATASALMLDVSDADQRRHSAQRRACCAR